MILLRESSFTGFPAFYEYSGWFSLYSTMSLKTINMKKLLICSTAFPFLCALMACSHEEGPITPPDPEPIVDMDSVNYYDPYENDGYCYIQKKSPKRGLGFSWGSVTDVDLLGPGVSWSYNWGNTMTTQLDSKMDEYGIEYCPMTWNANYSATNITNYAHNHARTKHLLTYNEPNLKGQAMMTPSDAAADWPNIKQIATNAGLSIISPAMTYGTYEGWTNGVAWLDAFFGSSGVSVNDVDGIAVHCYYTNFKTAIDEYSRYKKFNKPVWLTEFCSWNDGQKPSAPAAQCEFMSKMINYMEQDDMLGRYAWFIARGGYASDSRGMYLLSVTAPITLTDPGLVYANMSSFDKEAVYPMGQRIPAEHYRKCNIQESTYQSVSISPTSDKDGILQLTNMNASFCTDYMVNLDGKQNADVRVRYSTTRDNSVVGLYAVDEMSDTETLLCTITLPTTGSRDIWRTAAAKANLPNGATIIRLRPVSGVSNINWIEIK